MNITLEQSEILRKHGFKWFKDQCTDTVTLIDKIMPIEGGFVVVYDDAAVFAVSCAEVEKIEWREDPSKEWIYVHWTKIKDYCKPVGVKSER